MTDSPETERDSIATIYSQKIRTIRTRSYALDIPERENEVGILHTLLGIELKVGRRRFACPDLPTARYLRVFARLGCREFAVPYDITKISTIADELETSWQRALLLLESSTAGLTDLQIKRRRSDLIKTVRMEIAAIGPGEKMPLFNQSTKQRSS